jgi:hypothetical protein
MHRRPEAGVQHACAKALKAPGKKCRFLFANCKETRTKSRRLKAGGRGVNVCSRKGEKDACFKVWGGGGVLRRGYPNCLGEGS